MSLRLSECDFEYLRPPKDVFNVQHTGNRYKLLIDSYPRTLYKTRRRKEVY